MLHWAGPSGALAGTWYDHATRPPTGYLIGRSTPLTSEYWTCAKHPFDVPTVAAMRTTWPRCTTVGDEPARPTARIKGATSRSGSTALYSFVPLCLRVDRPSEGSAVGSERLR